MRRAKKAVDESAADEGWPETYVPLALKTIRTDVPLTTMQTKIFQSVGKALGESCKTPKGRDLDEIAYRVRTHMAKVSKHQWHVIVGRDMTLNLRYRKQSFSCFKCMGAAKSVEESEAGSAKSHQGLLVIVFRTPPTPPVDAVLSGSKSDLEGKENVGGSHVSILWEGDGMDRPMLDTLRQSVKASLAEEDPEAEKTIKSALTQAFPGLWHIAIGKVDSFGAAVAVEDHCFALVRYKEWQVLAFRHVDSTTGSAISAYWMGAAVKVLYMVTVVAFLCLYAYDLKDEKKTYATWTAGGCLAAASALRMWQKYKESRDS